MPDPSISTTRLGSIQRRAILLGAVALVLCVNEWFAWGILQSAIMTEKQPLNVPNEQEEVTIIITSSLIPAHPSIRMINDTIQSLSMLKGLSPTAPIIISIDGLHPSKRTQENSDRLQGYARNLEAAYVANNETDVTRPVQILSHDDFLFIAGNINAAMQHVETDFVYVLQHDLYFTREIDHTALLQTMKEYPDILPIVRFNKRANQPVRSDWGPGCFGAPDAVNNNTHGLQFVKTPGWSDNNHLATTLYYREILDWMRREHSNLFRAPEAVMSGRAKANCSAWGPHLYGGVGEEAYLGHADGRHNANYRRS